MEHSQSSKHFIQAFMVTRVLSKKNAQALCKRAQQGFNETVVPLKEFLAPVNKSLEPLGMKIAQGRLEHDGTEWVGLVNTVQDAAAKRASGLTLAQQEYFKRLLEVIVSHDGDGPSQLLINMVDQLQRKLTRKAAQEFLKKLVKDRWLVELQRGHYGLGPRSVLELMPFMSELAGEEVDECKMCKRNVVMGQSCSSCGSKLHLYCLSRLAQRSDVVKCPNPDCRKQWEHDIPPAAAL